MACPAAATLASFVEGTLPSDASATIEDHLDRCATCRQTVSATVRGSEGSRPASAVGRYELLAPLGAGAMGVVYAAYDPELDRKVAIKVLTPDVDSDPARLAMRRERLAREARALARISHPNVVPVHDVGVANDRLFIAMELVAGETLRMRLAAGAQSTQNTLELVVQAAHGLAAAHAAGVIHRDFKPDNVLIGRDGRVRVGDFGLAGAELDHDAAEPEEVVDLTSTGTLLGTPAYMAPEQLRGEPATRESDQFSLCVTAWESLFGARPFLGMNAAELAEAARTGPAYPPRGDRRIAAALRVGLAYDPAQRYQDVETLIHSLERAVRPRRMRWIATMSALAVIAAATYITVRVSHGDACDTTLTVWSPAARAQLVSAFAAAGGPLAGEASKATVRAIDRWAERWSALATATCQADRARALPPERLAARRDCLHDRADELSRVLDALGRNNAAALIRAAERVGALGDLDACESPPARYAPRTAAEAETLQRARTSLTAARALVIAGKYSDSVAILSKVPEVADADLRAQIALELALANEALGALPAARDAVNRAVAGADAAHDDRLRARALIEMLRLVGASAVDLADGRRIEDQARAAVERVGAPGTLAAELDVAVAELAIRRGQLDAAAGVIAQAVDLYRAARPVDEGALADALGVMAYVHAQLGDANRSIREFDEARALAERALGPDHPRVAAMLASIVEPLSALGRRAEATTAARRAAEIYTRTLDANDVRIAIAFDSLASLYKLDGRLEDAVSQFERALHVREAALGPDHVDVAASWLDLASANSDAGHLHAAADAYARSLAIWTRALGSDHIDVARSMTGLADVEVRRNMPEHAIPLLERALAICEHNAVNPELVAHARFVLARALRALHRDSARVAALADAARAYYAKAGSTAVVAEIEAWQKAR